MALALALLVTYSICLIVAGHGAVPVALLLVSGGVDSWFSPGKIIGLLGIACLMIATVGTAAEIRRTIRPSALFFPSPICLLV